MALGSVTPPPLLHLGLPLNVLVSLPSTALVPKQWSTLLSLDVAHNWLADLEEAADTLAELPSLAVLQASGNPFTLLPEYRPYLVNRLSRIQYLDDERVEHKERLPGGVPPEFVLATASQVTVTVQRLVGLAEPTEYDGPPHGEVEEVPPRPRHAYTYAVGVSVPGSLASPNDGVAAGQQGAEATAEPANDTAEEVTIGTPDSADSADTGGANGTMAKTASMRWSQTIELTNDGSAFTFHCSDLTQLKRACEAGLTLGV